MLTQIQLGAKRGELRPSMPQSASLAEALQAGDPGDAVELLLGCHARIRHFTAVAVALSRNAASADQIGNAAQAVHRYYSQALPLHEADENDSVYPRLRAAAPPQELAEANQAMVDQHVAIDGVIARLLPLWQAIAEQPDRAGESAADAAALQSAWSEHLELEERLIFPALRTYLTPDDRAAIRQEMQQRRAAPASGSGATEPVRA